MYKQHREKHIYYMDMEFVSVCVTFVELSTRDRGSRINVWFHVRQSAIMLCHMAHDFGFATCCVGTKTHVHSTRHVVTAIYSVLFAALVLLLLLLLCCQMTQASKCVLFVV